MTPREEAERIESKAPCPHCGRTDWRWSGECRIGLRFSPEDRLEVRCDHCRPLRMEAYYYAFGATGVELIDRILSAVAHAGKGYHHTEGWNEPTEDWGPFRGGDYVAWIQNAADDAADALRAAEARGEQRGRVQGLRDAQQAVVEACGVCEGQGWVVGVETGDGHACDGTDESCALNCPVPVPVQVQERCEYCGRPSDAIRAPADALDQQPPTEPNAS